MKLFILSFVFFALVAANEFQPAPSQLSKYLPASIDQPASQVKAQHLISRKDFTINATFFMRFRRFKQKVDISFFYNRFGEIDYEFFPSERLLILFARNFRAHKACRQFMVKAVKNIAYQLITGLMKEASQSGSLVTKYPSVFVFSALKRMTQGSQAVIRYDYQLSTFTNRVYRIQFKYLLGNGIRAQDIRITATLHAGRVLHILQLLREQSKAQKNPFRSLMKFYRSFKDKVQNQTRIWTDNPVLDLRLTGNAAKINTQLVQQIRDNFSSQNLTEVLRSHKVEEANNYDWLRDMRVNSNQDVQKFMSNQFEQINTVSSFETYGIPQNRLWSEMRNGLKR